MIQSPGSVKVVARMGDTSGVPGSLDAVNTAATAAAITASLGGLGGVDESGGGDAQAARVKHIKAIRNRTGYSPEPKVLDGSPKIHEWPAILSPLRRSECRIICEHSVTAEDAALPSLPSPRMQRGGIVLRRRMRVGQQIERVLRDAVEIDAAAAHFRERIAHRGLARRPLRAGQRLALPFAAAPAAHRLEPRHLQHVERGDKPVDIDVWRFLQLAHVTLGERAQPLGQQPQLELLPGADARDPVGGARREGGTLPALVARPAADAGAADAGLGCDLAIAQRRVLDQVAHLQHLGVGVRAARRFAVFADRPRGDGVRVVGFDAEAAGGFAEEGDEGHG